MAKSAADPVVIVAVARTAMGGFQGALAPLAAPDLGAAAIAAAVARSGIAAADVSEVLMGCVLPAGRARPDCPTTSPAPPSTRCAVRA